MTDREPSTDTVMIAVSADDAPTVRWLAEAPLMVIEMFCAVMKTESIDTPMSCADDPEIAHLHGKTADQLFREAKAHPEAGAWLAIHQREWWERRPWPHALASTA